MDYVNTILTGSEANNFFGTTSRLCDNTVLEATLRYIAIKTGGDIEKVKMINALCTQVGCSDRGNKYAEAQYDDTELLILTPYRGNDLLTIDAEGWVSLDSPPYPVASLLTARSSETRIYINTAKKRAVVFVKTTTEKWCETFASCLLRVMPWRFDDNDEEQIKLAKAINKQDTDTFVSIINSCVKDFNFKDTMVKRHLLGWTSGHKDTQLKNLRAQMDKLMGDIRSYEETIASFLDQYQNINLNYQALLTVGNDKDEFYNFFVNHKQLELFKVYSSGNGKVLEYAVTETIEYFDEDIFKMHYNNPNSPFGTNNCNSDLREICYALFVEHKGVLRAEAIFKLTNLSSLLVVSHATTGNHGDTHLPHPHLVNHGCLGGNGTYINKYMAEGSWDLAIEQSIAAVKNINMGDTAVTTSMVRDLGRRMDICKCIIADNGREMTPNEFLVYIRSNKNNEGAANG